MERTGSEVIGRMREGAAEVYAVRELGSDRLAVAWVLPDDAPADFLAEALCALHHPALVAHLGLTETCGKTALLSGPIPIRTLRHQLDEHGPLPLSAAIQLGLRLAEGLTQVHEAGLLHGAVTVDAVHLEGHEVVLADFRQARFESDPASDLTGLASVLEEAVGPERSAPLQALIDRCRGLGEVPLASARALCAALLQAADSLAPSDTWPSIPPQNRVPVPLVDALEREGDVVGAYVLQRLLGEGSMGRVFAARHTRLGRTVALKILRPEHARSRETVQRFFQEARTVNEIDHAHIVEIFDFVEEALPGDRLRAYCVMELLEGECLTETLRRGPVPLEKVRRVAIQLCQALAAAHRVGVVHRDLKPDNVFVTLRDGLPFVKVVDFGVAKLVRPMGELPTGTTVDGAIIGTPSYMCPEQAQGLEVDFRADVHAIGVLLYELLSGGLPYTATRFGALAAQIITQPPAPLPACTPGGEAIPSALSSLVMQLLAKDPRSRPGSLEAVEHQLRHLALRGFPGRGRRVALAGAAMVALASAVVLTGPVHWRSADAAVPSPALKPVPAPPPAPVPTPPVHELVRALRPVRLEIATHPAGARVVRADTGEPLGTTPWVQAFEVEASPLPLRIELAGHTAVERTLPRDRDAQLMLDLAPLARGRTRAAAVAAPRKAIDPFLE
jgi:tRNA A-37 threonylcarbamoyl transferase component Bud32